MKPSSKKSNSKIYPYFLLFLQPIFMSSNLIIARGGVEFVPTHITCLLEMDTCFFLFIPFFYKPIKKNLKKLKPEFFKLFFLGLMGCCLWCIPIYCWKNNNYGKYGNYIYIFFNFYNFLSTFFLKELKKF